MPLATTQRYFAESKVLDEHGNLLMEDEVVDLSDVIAEGWISLVIFWVLGLTVFYQFITRYVLNDSAAWTEEVARYMLIGVVFIGVSVGVRQEQPDSGRFLLSPHAGPMGRWLSRAVDVLRTAFFAARS